MTPPCRAWRPALVALAIATSLCATPSRAQDAEPAPLGLRDGAESPAPLGLREDGESLSPSSPSSPDAAAGEPRPDAQKNKQKKKKKKIDPRDAPPPALQIYHGAERAGLPGGPPAIDPALTPPPTIAATPTIPAKRRPVADDKPFDPVGIMLGDIKLLPTLEEDVGYASNPALLPGPTKGSAYESTQAGLLVQSDWARNELRGSFSGGYADYFSVPQANGPNGAGTLDGRLDVSRDVSLDAEGRFTVVAQTPGSVTLPTGVALAPNERPLVETFGATLGGVEKFGDLALSLHGTLDRIAYQNATLSDGSIDDLASDDYNDWGLRARAAYQISPVITPFVETVIDTRRYDDVVDSNGYARSSNGALGRAGATLALTGQLTGDASLGYGERQYQDARLPDLRAPLVDASLIWSTTPLTTVTLKTSTSLADTTNIGDSGAVTRTYTIDVSQALLRNLTLGASAGYVTDVYAGVPLHDSTTSFGLRADYNVTRDIVLRASVSHAQYVSSAPGSNYINNVFMLGLRLQR
jgi:hypothetical protein